MPLRDVVQQLHKLRNEISQLPLPDETVYAGGTRTLARWINEKREWEAREFGKDPWEFEGDEFANFLRTHVLAAVVELGEMLKETKWKTWTVERGRPGTAGHLRALEEFVDVLNFLGNVAAVMRFSGEDVDRMLDTKYAIITKRQRSGTYTGISEKCGECGR